MGGPGTGCGRGSRSCKVPAGLGNAWGGDPVPALGVCTATGVAQGRGTNLFLLSSFQSSWRSCSRGVMCHRIVSVGMTSCGLGDSRSSWARRGLSCSALHLPFSPVGSFGHHSIKKDMKPLESVQRRPRGWGRIWGGSLVRSS